MEDIQRQFIGLLAKADLTAADFNKRETARDAGLAAMRMELDGEFDEPVLDEKGNPTKDAQGKPITQKVTMRDSIRSGMTFKVYERKKSIFGKEYLKERGDSFHEDGQEHAIDTHDVVAKGYEVTKQDYVKMERAMANAMKLVDKLRAQEGPDGEPLYSDADLMEEVFTPLMREGLLPDNVIIDKYSGTSELLKGTFDRYKKALKEAEEAEAKKRDENTVNIGGAKGKIGQVKALAGKAGELKAQMQANLMAKAGISETTLRRAKLGKEIFSDAKGFLSDNKSDIEDLIPDALKNDAKDFIAPITDHLDKAKKAFDDDLQKHAPFLTKPVGMLEGKVEGLLGFDTGDDDKPSESEFKKIVAKVQATRAMEVLDHFGTLISDKIQGEVAQAQWLQKAGDALTGLALKVEFKLDEIPLFGEFDAWRKEHEDKFTDMCKGLLSGLKDMGKDTASDVFDMKGLSDSLKKTDNQHAIQAAVRQAAQQIDAAIAEAVTAVAGVAGVAISGQFVKRTKVDDAVNAAVEEPTKGGEIVTVFAAGLEAAFASAAPAPSDPPDGTEGVFAKMGTTVANAFRGKASGDQLTKTLGDDPVAAMGTVVQAAQAAAKKELGALGGTDAPTDGGDVAAFKKLVTDPKKQQALLAAGSMPDPVEMELEMQESDEEIKKYEDSLMLIDEGGFDAAQSRNIEVLIAELKQNRKMLELAANLGQGMLSAGVSALKPIADTGLGMHATDVLKLAKMIATLAVNIKKAADRWLLWYKFRTTLERSKKAVSALTSTIQGFFNNKKEQIAFHTIDDAMQAVQIAFTIVGMVPEPITMGVGKTVNLVAKGVQVANQIAGKVYNEAMLSKAWSTTVKAMNNPANRQLGLAALRLNPTLGMHAVAWAGAERQPPDPIARHLLDRLGINAQTIAAGASGDQLKDYLTELLNEDRQLDLISGVVLDWMPPSVTLTAKDFFVVTNRASTMATPKLGLGGETAVIDALKALDNHDPDSLKPDADKGELLPVAIEAMVDQAELVSSAMRDYVPKAVDGTIHEEMANVLADFMNKARIHFNKMETIQTLNLTIYNGQNSRLKAVAGKVRSIRTETEKAALTTWAAEATDAINAVSGNRTLSSRDDVKSMLGDVTRARDDAQERAALI